MHLAESFPIIHKPDEIKKNGVSYHWHNVFHFHKVTLFKIHTQYIEKIIFLDRK